MRKKLNIVIVTYNWPPRNAIGTHRPYAWARYWSEAGADVTVLTSKKRKFDAPLDLELPSIDGVEVIEIPYKGAVGWLGAYLNSGKARVFAQWVKGWLRKTSSIPVDPRMPWRKFAKSTAERLAVTADIVVSTYGPAACHLIGYDMKLKNPSVFWLADYRDLWSQAHTVNYSSSVKIEIEKTELGTVGANADLLSAVSEDMVEKLGSLTGKEVLQVANGFDIDEKLIRQRLVKHAHEPCWPMRIVYTGGIYPGHQDPTPLLDALVRLQEQSELLGRPITLDVYGARVEFAEQLAKVPAYTPFVRLMGHVTRDEALLAQGSASVLLLLESPAIEAKGVLTGKLFEYMASGRPILCVGSKPEYEIGGVLRATGTGLVVGPDQQFLLDKLLLETMSGGGIYECYKPNLEEVLKYSRQRQSEYLLDALSKRMKMRNGSI